MRYSPQDLDSLLGSSIMDSRDIEARREELQEERDDLTVAIEDAEQDVALRYDDLQEAQSTLDEMQLEAERSDEHLDLTSYEQAGDKASDALADAESELKRLRDELVQWDAGYAEELRDITALCEECEDYGDWSHGETLVADEYIEDYFRELASDCGYIESGKSANPLLDFINWEAWAEHCLQDYTAVECRGNKFWVRSV